MAQFKVIVQIYKELRFEAPDQATAMKMAEEEVRKQGITDRINVNMPSDLDKKKAQRKAREEARKAKLQKKSPVKVENQSV